MKSRGCYETPGGTLIMAAHRELEALTLDKNMAHYKQKLALDYAEMVYNGLWFTPLRESLDAFFDRSQRNHHRRSHAAPVQGQHPAGQPQIALFAVFAQHRQLHHGRRIRSARRARLHQPDRPADPGARLAQARRPPREQTRMKLWGGRFERRTLRGLRALFRLAAFRPAADRRRYPRLAGLRAGARRRRHPDRGRARRSWSRRFETIRRRGRTPGVFRRRRRTKTSTRWSSASSRSGPARWPIRSTPAAAATIRSRSICACGCARRSTRVAACCCGLMAALLACARRDPDAVIPGYTHMRRAQAVLWPHYLLAYFEMFARDHRAASARPARA